ncbi:MAG: c-type cytochrome, partial [Solimonas sp.]
MQGLSALPRLLAPLLLALPAYAAAPPPADPHAALSSQPPPLDSIDQRVLPCMACHGKEGRATSDGYYPRIAGKPAGYLYNQLLNFREGRRNYPMMTYVVERQTDVYLHEMAAFFSSQHLPYPPPQAPDVGAEVIERGRQLVTAGDEGKQIPACQACHGTRLTGALPATPGLLGLSHDYLMAQLGAWRQGNRHAHAPDCMAQVAQRLAPADLYAAAAWLATQSVPADASPSAPIADLPLRCGSAPEPGATQAA